MATVRITKEFSFEMAHALEGYDGACSQIHGHSYRFFVTVSGSPNEDAADPKYGMVMDFGGLKAIVARVIIEKYDHALVIRETERSKELIEVLKRDFGRIITTDYQPTCENMVVRFADMIRAELPPHIRLHSLRLHETATSFAEWFADDNE